MKVWPRDDSVRRLYKHPTAGAFRAEGSAEWPRDQFTWRSIKDGIVLTTPPKSEQPKVERRSERKAEEPKVKEN